MGPALIAFAIAALSIACRGHAGADKAAARHCPGASKSYYNLPKEAYSSPMRRCPDWQVTLRAGVAYQIAPDHPANLKF